MHTVKHYFSARLSSNVGTGLLILAGLISPPASAAYYVLEDPEMLAHVQDQQGAPQHAVPFFAGRAYFGPKGRAAMNALLKATRNGGFIEIVGTPDFAGQPHLAFQRASAIRRWLIEHGIPDTSIAVRTVDAAAPNASMPRVFNSTVTIRREATTAPTHQKLAPSYLQKALTYQTVLTMYKQERITTADAIDMLAVATKRRPATAPSNIIHATTPTTKPTLETAHTWPLFAGQTLRSILATWTRQAGWNTPQWMPADPYYIETNYQITGSFKDAIDQLSTFVPSLQFQYDPEHRMIRVSEKAGM